jgi:hypothetical protein
MTQSKKKKKKKHRSLINLIIINCLQPRKFLPILFNGILGGKSTRCRNDYFCRRRVSFFPPEITDVSQRLVNTSR